MNKNIFTKLMFKRTILLVILTVLVSLSHSFVVTTYAYSNIPVEVRIGLFFNDSQTGQYSAVSSFVANANGGLSIGCFANGKLDHLMEYQQGTPLVVSKDSFYIKSDDKTTEYDPSLEQTLKGEKMGPYHVKIGDVFADYASLGSELLKIQEKGIDAYPVYDDGWQIWTGFYVDENDAEMAVLYLISPILGEKDYKVISPSPSRISVSSEGGKTVLLFDSKSHVFTIKPGGESKPGFIRLDGDDSKRYRGRIEVQRFLGSDMTLINVLPMEEYLYGVVPCEIQAGSHPEALKAQAVAARTYTVNNLKKYERLNFNMCATTYSQVYRGFNGEAGATSKAIDDTRGEIVTYEGKPASIFYFSSSGGKTEDVKNVWGSDGYPYLVSVEDKYESGKSWHYNWENSFTAQRIKEIMVGRGFNIGDILGIHITKRSEAGRAVEVVLRGSKGERVYKNSLTRDFLSLDSQWYDIITDADTLVKKNELPPSRIQIAGKKIMTATGLKTLDTSKKTVKALLTEGATKIIPLTPTVYTFKGKGWGHAVGMSQEGAKGMAEAGFTYDKILTHYFTGTKVEQADF
ncbi:MAG: SpoIID/LytB domain-containing protein [Clostridium sp.]|nr:SpoIID/LytB domain-containing protein [Clostridium sp.]